MLSCAANSVFRSYRTNEQLLWFFMFQIGELVEALIEEAEDYYYHYYYSRITIYLPAVLECASGALSAEDTKIR